MPAKLHVNQKLHRGYGWKRGLPDPRKPFYNITFAGDVPDSVDLREKCPAVYDQGQLGSCTANALAGLSEFLLMKQGVTSFVPSRLFIYYNERALEGTVTEDSGATLTDGATVVSKYGAPHESLWWYNTDKFKVKPNAKVYADGLKYKLGGAARVNQNLDDFRKVLAGGNPIVGGFSVFESFESDAVAKTGIVPMPGSDEQLLGGHAIMIVGYNNAKNWFIVRNSWGASWGAAGYFYMPYDYFMSTDLADDFWTASSVLVTQ